MILPILREAAARGELVLADGGLLRYHVRRDGVAVVREILVLPEVRRRGIGRALVAEMMRRTRAACAEARCPWGEEYDAANAFWPGLRFALAGTAGRVNLWRRWTSPREDAGEPPG